jgi:hypothetical protein
MQNYNGHRQAKIYLNYLSFSPTTFFIPKFNLPDSVTEYVV